MVILNLSNEKVSFQNKWFWGEKHTASQMSSLLILDKLGKMSPNPQKILSHVDYLLKEGH